MTRRLYNEDSYRKSFRATVVSCLPYREKMYQVVLDRTAFFPEGGGQSSDTGTLGNVAVIDVREVEEDVIHITKEPLEVGGEIEGVIDWELRFDKMQQHTAEHIASGILDRKYGFQNVGFHLNREIVTMDFDGVITREQGNELEREINAAVTANVPIHVSYPAKEELKDIQYRSKIEIEGQVRIVVVEGYDTCACCAPHVRTTGEIGMVKLTEIQSHRGGVRITMVCGQRALLDYQEKSASVKGISVLLSAKEQEVLSSVERLKEEVQSVKSEVWKLQNLLICYKMIAISGEEERVLLFEEELDTEHAREMVNQLLQKGCGIVAVFLINKDQGYHYIIGSKTEDIRGIGRAINERCNGRGGGKPMMVQGNVMATREEIELIWSELE